VLNFPKLSRLQSAETCRCSKLHITKDTGWGTFVALKWITFL
jgi:hypothetical protein